MRLIKITGELISTVTVLMLDHERGYAYTFGSVNTNPQITLWSANNPTESYHARSEPAEFPNLTAEYEKAINHPFDIRNYAKYAALRCQMDFASSGNLQSNRVANQWIKYAK